MEFIKQYLMTLIGAAIICGIVLKLINTKTTAGSLIKLMCGIFITLCAISPIVELDFSSAEMIFDPLYIDTSGITADNELLIDSSLRQSIKEQTESYILDKAAAMNTELLVEVRLSDDKLPVPSGVTLTGTISPFVKIKMTEFLVSELGISKENQVWVR